MDIHFIKLDCQVIEELLEQHLNDQISYYLSTPQITPSTQCNVLCTPHNKFPHIIDRETSATLACRTMKTAETSINCAHCASLSQLTRSCRKHPNSTMSRPPSKKTGARCGAGETALPTLKQKICTQKHALMTV